MKNKLGIRAGQAQKSRQALSLLEIMIAMTILALGLSALSSSVFSLNRGNQMILENRRAVEVAQMVLERVQAEAWSSLGRSPATWHRRETPISGVTEYIDELSSTPDTEFMHRPLVDEPLGMDLYKYLQYGDIDFQHMSKDEDEAAPTTITIHDLARDPYNLPYVKEKQMAEYNGVDPLSAEPAQGKLPAEIINKYDTSDRYNWLQFLGITDKRSGLVNLEVYVEYYNQAALDGVFSRDEFSDAIDQTKNNYHLPQSHILLDLEELDPLDSESVVIRIIVNWDRRVGGAGRHVLTVARRQ